MAGSWFTGINMELSDAITILVVGFMGLIGFWLTSLTYLVFKYEEEYKAEEAEEGIESDANLDLQIEPSE